jgi:hypothetical protein
MGTAEQGRIRDAVQVIAAVVLIGLTAYALKLALDDRESPDIVLGVAGGACVAGLLALLVGWLERRRARRLAGEIEDAEARRNAEVEQIREQAQRREQELDQRAREREQQAEQRVEETQQQAEQPTEPGQVEGQILLQEEDTVLGSSMIGSTVYSPTDESIGKISDVLIKMDGTVQGVVIGVGGFLGIGQKRVAVEMKTLSITPEQEGQEVRLVLSSTKEELEKAPAFKTAAEQEAERQAEQTRQQQGQVPSPTAPTAPPAPAD